MIIHSRAEQVGLSSTISAAVVHRVSHSIDLPIWPARLADISGKAMNVVVEPTEVGSVAVTKWNPGGETASWQDELPLFLASLAADLPNLRHLNVQTPSTAQSLRLGITALAPALCSLTVAVESDYNKVFRPSLELPCLANLVMTLP
ncbi:hypothetical protein AMAG_20690 [Allomyces macrogynus ATCC 38327]|uniref:Uncharacterized protein n=1 Tax=Allomyces macrogynus (strain ATCC 38327) TaxID=578462 RepID=A0A0L0TEQ3_ALLM3|nr:hypothetical protein AMAG_20690 [Allomyces macrogynus ATCC 38327]|eukprot:KNE73054.1 hypothetical protein AMAG_20690 [Allomyces macrogynus ATCC 38327]